MVHKNLLELSKGFFPIGYFLQKLSAHHYLVYYKVYISSSDQSYELQKEEKKILLQMSPFTIFRSSTLKRAVQCLHVFSSPGPMQKGITPRPLILLHLFLLKPWRNWPTQVEWHLREGNSFGCIPLKMSVLFPFQTVQSTKSLHAVIYKIF